MKRIPLTKGKEALVDDEDYEYLMQWKWHLAGGRYAARTDYSGGRHRDIYMHKVVMERTGLTPSDRGDHRNRDELDNRRNNLRPATFSENGQNYGLRKDNKSGYKGVTWSRRHGCWRARITILGRQTFLGHFGSKTDAARAYNEAAVKLFGEFAVLNPV